jgi:hypothetical protein
VTKADVDVSSLRGATWLSGRLVPADDRQSRSDHRLENTPKDPRRCDACEPYFRYAAELLKVNPPHIADQPMIAQLKKIGIEPGRSFGFDKADPVIRNAVVSLGRTRRSS